MSVPTLSSGLEQNESRPECGPLNTLNMLKQKVK
jgi:hypothetical protein